MMPRSVAKRHLPDNVALVEIVGGDALVRGLDQQQAIDQRYSERRRVTIGEVAAGGIAGHRLDKYGDRRRRHVQSLRVRIERGATVVRATTMPGQHDRAFLGWRSEQ